MNFSDLKLVKPLLKALSDVGYSTPTPIQEAAIPVVLDRHDLLATAQTGTGKTAAFALPILHLIHQIDIRKGERPRLRALIVTPTRELAIQIEENLALYGKHTAIRHTVIYGGVKQGKQVRELQKGIHILVATPGRLLDLIGQGYIDLSALKIFVLDEADRMLDMGFIHDIKRLIKLIPKKRQSLFFSATMPKNIIELSRKILSHPKKIAVDPVSSAAETVQQVVYYTNRDRKKKLLLHILNNQGIFQALVFSRTKHGADRIARDLKKKKIKSAAIHGDKMQNYRQKVLKQFKDKKLHVLVATDIAARGIDISHLEHVINYDIPNEPETYVHRIGRCGRAGEEGTAISICEPEENQYMRDIEKLLKRKVTAVTEHPYPQTDKPMTAAEKKEWNKEKQRRKQKFHEQRRKSRQRASR